MFKIGQKVVCVRPSGTGRLVKGEIYTIRDIHYEGACGLRLYETRPLKGGWFHNWRFEPLQDDWVDNLINKIAREARKDELAPV